LIKGLIATSVLLGLALALYGAADPNQTLVGDESDGSRAVPVHLIDLLIADELDENKVIKITPDDKPLLPFSTRSTCGACHSYNVISHGWHFNAADPNVSPGRPAQPWIFVDAATGTQIPVS
jgi:hypothetical protein